MHKPRVDILWACIARVATFVLFASAWELFARRAQSLLVPTFGATMKGLYDLLFVSGRIWHPLYVSNQAMVLGYVLAVAVGLTGGLLMARARWMDRAAAPYIAIALGVPIAPFFPIFLMALGLGLTTRVFVVFAFTVVFVLVNTRAGVRSVDPSLLEMATAFGATERQKWIKILIPGAMPAIAAGLRIALGRAVLGMVLVELLLVATGIGLLLLEFRGDYRSDLVFATVIVTLLEGVVLMSSVRLFERWIFKGGW